MTYLGKNCKNLGALGDAPPDPHRHPATRSSAPRPSRCYSHLLLV